MHLLIIRSYFRHYGRLGIWVYEEAYEIHVT